MKVGGNERSRVKPHVVSIKLADRPGQADMPDTDVLKQLSAGQLKMLRGWRRAGWTEAEKQPESGITADQLSITGMSLVCNPRVFWLRRTIWLAIIVCLLVWLCLQLWFCVERLSTGGTERTWYRHTLDKIPLPAITVCHGNRFKKSVVLRHQTGNASWLRWHHEGYQTLNWTSFDGLDEFYDAASYSWYDMVFFCNVDRRWCSEIGTLLTVNTVLNGRCTTFNTNDTVTKRLTSAQIELRLFEREPLNKHEHNSWKIFLHPQNVEYNDFLFLSGLFATVEVFGNRKHQVKVHRRITAELPQGMGNGCNPSPDALEAYLNCLIICMRRSVTKWQVAPVCSVPWIPKKAYGPNMPPCRTMEELDGSTLGEHHGADEQTFLNWIKMECSCAPPCLVDQYQIEEHEKWHVQETTMYMSNPGYRNTTVSVAMLWLSDMEERINEREEYSFNTFMADVGGHLGLMLGGSLLTFVEIVDCTIASCLSRWQKRAKQSF